MQRARGRQKIVVGTFGADTRLDGVAIDAQLALHQGQFFSRGNAQLPLDEIETRYGFGHRMLHLQASVHLHKEEIHSLVGALLDNEFNRARTHIVDRARRSHGGLAHLLAHRLGHAGRWRFFQHLLMPPLHRTVTLEQIHVVAMRVAEHLDFDMARPLRVLFDQHHIIAKAGDGLALARLQRLVEILGFIDGAHALASAAGAGFDQYRVADAVCLAL